MASWSSVAPACTVIAPLPLSMSNTASEAVSREYVIVSPVSASVAVIVATAVPPALFSATDAVVGWLANTGAVLGGSSSSFTVTLAEDVAPTV